MIRIFILLVSLAFSSSALAQYDYFNLIEGDLNDNEEELATNVEFISTSYVIWGAGTNSDQQQLFVFIRSYDLSGSLLIENVINVSNEYILAGITNSFKWNPYNEKFVFIHGVVEDAETKGYLIEFDQNLDTTFTKRYSHYSPYTYPLVFEIMQDGYIVLGEHGGINNSNGTFIMKLDFDGNIIWSEILQEEIYQNIYRNWNIIQQNNDFLIFGGGNTPENNFNPFGLITKISNIGITQSTTTILDEDALRSGYLNAVKLENGEILVSQPISYELLDPNGSQDAFWNKIRLFKFDPETEEIYAQQDYFSNYELKQGRVFDMEATADGGAIILGRSYAGFYSYYSWFMKVDSEGNQEWYQEYTYETCDDCRNMLYDIELAPDGGYVAAGSFANWSIDLRQATWLLKIDECGDVEWQGCNPLSVNEVEKKLFSVYPNPSVGRLFIDQSSANFSSRYEVFDISGKLVAQNNNLNQQSKIEINLTLPNGLYLLKIETPQGEFETQLIEIIGS